MDQFFDPVDKALPDVRPLGRLGGLASRELLCRAFIFRAFGTASHATVDSFLLTVILSHANKKLRLRGASRRTFVADVG